MSVEDVITVFIWIIDFGNKDDGWELFFYLRNGPSPKLYRNHFGHVTTESVNLLRCPEQQNVEHFVPSIRYRVKVSPPSVHVINSVVQFHGFIPVVHVGPGIEPVVAGSAGRTFNVALPINLTA